MRAYEVDIDKVGDRERWWGNIRIVVPPYKWDKEEDERGEKWTAY